MVVSLGRKPQSSTTSRLSIVSVWRDMFLIVLSVFIVTRAKSTSCKRSTVTEEARAHSGRQTAPPRPVDSAKKATLKRGTAYYAVIGFADHRLIPGPASPKLVKNRTVIE